VELKPDLLLISFSGRRFIGGTLFKTIDTTSSTWFIGEACIQTITCKHGNKIEDSTKLLILTLTKQLINCKPPVTSDNFTATAYL